MRTLFTVYPFGQNWHEILEEIHYTTFGLPICKCPFYLVKVKFTASKSFFSKTCVS